MHNDDSDFDPFRTLSDHAVDLNSMCSPASSPRVNYEFLSGALVWSDETPHTTPIEVVWALRFIRAYRTSLMLHEPRDEFKPIWNHGLALFPDWVGFRPERREATPEILRIYRRGNVSLRWCLRKLDRESAKEDAQEGSKPE